MSEIKTFAFNKKSAESIRSYKYGKNWPVVYLLENGKEMYVGETTSAYYRTRQHLDNPDKQIYKKAHLVSDDEYNMSATKDIESSLIEYLIADGKYNLQNGNGGMQNHNFFDRERYQGKFDVLWETLQKRKIATKDLIQIRNSDLFKYSPYKTLADDQYLIAEQLLAKLGEDKKQTYVVHGGPGTGKTILATFLIKQLIEKGDKKVALVIAMASLRRTLKKVFKNVPGLDSSLVIGPHEVVREKYDILVVDETHRLRRRVNISNYNTFDRMNKHFGLSNEGDELDWILRSAKQTVFFVDKNQSVRPSDVSVSKLEAVNPIIFELKAQLRVKGGEEYLSFVDGLLEVEKSAKPDFSDYDFRVFDDLRSMIEEIKAREKEHTLSRLVAGYAWKWISRDKKGVPDIVIDGVKLFWNSRITDWVNSPNAINEVGCIHTIQGYDLNYTGVIIGPEISYDSKKKEIVIDKSNYLDMNGHRGITDQEELKRYIINIYKTLLTRGILGTYLYVVDDGLREYIKSQSKITGS